MQHPKLDVLKYEPMPELAAALRGHKVEIISMWQKKVLDVLPQADELTLSQLRNSLPELLTQIADALEASEPGPTHELIEASPEHGEARFHENFNLNELLIEYHLLRGTIFEQIGFALRRPLRTLEVIGLNSGIDVAMRRAAVAFAQHQSHALTSEAESTSKHLSFLSHDIRGSLNAVLLMAEVLRRELSKEPKFAESVSDLDLMRRSMLETVSTMDRFLNAERLRRGKMPVVLTTVNVPQLLNNLAKSFTYPLREQRLSLEIDVAPNLTIVSDHDLLQLIVQNLISNAIKYSSKGTVRVSAKAMSAKGDVRMSVSDEGPGIAEDLLKTIFAPFTRGETHGKSGTGLGLTIARQSADLLKAKLRAESVVGKGTTFHLDLPAHGND